MFLIAYYVTPLKYKRLVLLLGSLLFYAVGDLKMFPVLLGAVIINYLFSKALRGGGCKALLAFVVILDAIMLVEFKLLSQFADQSLMPVGISFFTFKMISFQVDNFRGEISSEPDFVDTAAYFCMFPQVVSGPIMRYEAYDKNIYLKEKVQLTDILSSIEDGLRFFIVGLGMKVLLADYLSMLWNDIGTIGYESISTPLAWLGAVTYSMELYFDFWGYSLMAAGLGVMLGFPFIVNFDQPYSSKNVAEFYRRWHASLGSFFRDYIYFPMGGSRKGTARTILNLLTVWLVTGFWHGVTLNFILWGLIIFAIIVCEKYVLVKLPDVLGNFIGRINVLVLIPLTWVVFAISDKVQLLDYFKRLFPFFGAGISVNENDFIKNLTVYGVILAFGVILLIPKVYDFFEDHRKHPLMSAALFILFWACVYSLSNAAGNPFMYFRF